MARVGLLRHREIDGIRHILSSSALYYEILSSFMFVFLFLRFRHIPKQRR
jgi:Zn-dependent membrane protease YugP